VRPTTYQNSVKQFYFAVLSRTVSIGNSVVAGHSGPLGSEDDSSLKEADT
jgi:hypothetical protein